MPRKRLRSIGASVPNELCARPPQSLLNTCASRATVSYTCSRRTPWQPIAAAGTSARTSGFASSAGTVALLASTPLHAADFRPRRRRFSCILQLSTANVKGSATKSRLNRHACFQHILNVDCRDPSQAILSPRCHLRCTGICEKIWKLFAARREH